VSSENDPYDLIVIGGGPAGYFAAITAAEKSAAAGAGLRILILEKARRTLGKVLISGGGRCNVTHAEYDPARLVQHYPRGGAALRGPFARFQPADTSAWFEGRGVRLKTEADGRIFPVTDSSLTIVESLERAARQAGVKVWTLAEAVAVQVNAGGGFQVEVHLRRTEAAGPTGMRTLLAARLLLASGGERGGFRLASELGHAIVPPVPSLFTFKIPDPRLEGLAGISVSDAELELVQAQAGKHAVPRQRGPVLITHWGLSGPGVLRLSAWGARALHAHTYQMGLRLNWLAPKAPATARDELMAFKAAPENSRKKAQTHSPYPQLPARLYERLAAAAEIGAGQNWGDVSRTQIERLALELSAGEYRINGKGPFKEEFVTAGGVALDEVDFKTMHSRLVPGLFFAGEVLDIDGLTGGFNFQNAWTTGWIAGEAVGEVK
jgi:predicted Rossmann fold flavoprotein